MKLMTSSLATRFCSQGLIAMRGGACVLARWSYSCYRALDQIIFRPSEKPYVSYQHTLTRCYKSFEARVESTKREIRHDEVTEALHIIFILLCNSPSK